MPEHERARLLLAAGVARAAIAAGQRLDAEQSSKFDRLVTRRLSGEPLQYIEGSVQFGPIELSSDSRALIPRPETEQLFERALPVLAEMDSPVVVDLCTGSGNLALAIKHDVPAATVYATDSSSDALELAAENRAALGLDVTFLKGDMFAPLPSRLLGAVDLIVANPPYVPTGDLTALPVEIRDHEPLGALDGGVSGLDALDRIASRIGDFLPEGGRFIVEIGADQGSAVRSLFAGLHPVVEQDLAGRDRFVTGRTASA